MIGCCCLEWLRRDCSKSAVVEGGRRKEGEETGTGNWEWGGRDGTVLGRVTDRKAGAAMDCGCGWGWG